MNWEANINDVIDLCIQMIQLMNIVFEEKRSADTILQHERIDKKEILQLLYRTIAKAVA